MKNIFGTIIILLTSSGFAADLVKIKGVLKEVDGKAKIENLLQDTYHRALYKFDLDTRDQSNCDSKCAETWAPYILTAEEAANVQEPLRVITRKSGHLQLAYGDSPLYYFFQDRTDADFKGDGVGGVWHYVEIE